MNLPEYERRSRHSGATRTARYIVCNRNFAIQEYAVAQAPANSRIYLDHAATTPIRPEALAAMQEGFALWANPSSPHAEGRKAKQALEDARARVKVALGWDGEVIFTSGASEAAALAYDQSSVLHEVSSSVEHDCIHGIASERADTICPVLANGAVDVAALKAASVPNSAVPGPPVNSENRSLVFVQHINSETGNRQDIGEVSKAIRENAGLLVVDCAQSAGKFPVPKSADMAIISAHKFGGPIGVGALLVRDYAMLIPTGGHERGYRRGTENLPHIMGMVAALEAGSEHLVDAAVLEPLEEFAKEVRALGGVWRGDRLSEPTPYIQAITMPGISGSAQLMRFDMAGIAISQGSACSSGTLKPSHVLAAMGIDEDSAARTIRMSVGWNTTRAEVERFCEVWLEMARGK